MMNETESSLTDKGDDRYCLLYEGLTPVMSLNVGEYRLMSAVTEQHFTKAYVCHGRT